VEALDGADQPYVLALKPQKATWTPAEAAHTPVEAAQAPRWGGPAAPGGWTRVPRRFRDGQEEVWWAAEPALGSAGPERLPKFYRYKWNCSGRVAPNANRRGILVRPRRELLQNQGLGILRQFLAISFQPRGQ
jgi:hypothetical protein